MAHPPVAGHAGHDHDHHDHDHDHAHDHQVAHKDRGRLTIALILTGSFMLVEAVAGWLSGSLALIADAGHMFTDAASLALALLAVRISERPADSRRSFGYERMQVLAAFVNGLALIAIVVWIAIEAILRLWQPQPVQAWMMLVVAGLGLAVNAVSFLVLHGGDRQSLNMRGAVAHVLSDLLGSVSAIVAGVVILFTGWTAADPLLSLLVAGLILRTGLRIVAESGHILLEGAPEAFVPADLESRLVQGVAAVTGVHHIHLWSITPKRRVITLHATVKPEADGDQAVEDIVRLLRHDAQIEHVTVQIERERCADHLHRPPPPKPG